MTVAAFDTLKFVRALREKADIQNVRTDLQETGRLLKADLREAELRLEAKIEAIKAEIIKWMFGTIGFQTLIVLGAVVALARLLQP